MKCFALSIISFVLLLLVSRPVQAVLVLEYDFRTDENASYAGAGVPSGGNLGGAASVTTGTATGAGNTLLEVSPSIQNGYMTIASRGQSSPHVTGDFMTTSATYAQIFSAAANNFGSGTFVTVVRPNFNSPVQRQWFMTHTQAGTANYIGTLSDGPARIAGGRSTENSFTLSAPSPGSVPWVNGDWFLVATSWEQSSGSDSGAPSCCGDQGLADGKLRSYVRQLTSGSSFTPYSSTFFNSDDATRLWHTRFATDSLNSALTLGNRRGFGGSELSEGGTGDYALFRFYDTTFELADFDAEFSSLIQPVPEPSSALLLGMGLLGLVRMRKRKARC